MNRVLKDAGPIAVTCICGLVASVLPFPAGRTATNREGALLFQQKCATCHGDDGESRAPSISALHQLSRQAILSALTTGGMSVQGSSLTPAQKKAVARFLSSVESAPAAGRPDGCMAKPKIAKNDPGWNGWGFDKSNTRFEPGAVARLDASDVPHLKLKWAFGFPGASATFGQPTVYGGRVFAGSEDGTVYSLDAKTGCIYWTYKAVSTVKTAVSIGIKGHAAFFGDVSGNAYALDPATGNLLWKAHVDSHPAARITGSPLLWRDRLYVPVSSGEEGAAIDPKYPCCTFRGSVVALDARTGKQIWKTYTIPEPAHPTVHNSAGTQLWGPSGAAVWSSPTIDPKRRAIYVATGNSYSDPASSDTDAVMALNVDTGKMLWERQLTPNDRWNTACVAPDKANCPKSPGSDFDFGAPPILVTLSGKRSLLIAPQKSGIVYALDPDRQGGVVWASRIGKGGPLGGVEWGGAAERRRVFFPLSDWDDTNPNAGGGLFALSAATGRKIWYSPPAKPDCASQTGCSAAQMAPVTAIPGVVFSGSEDGHIRAYDTHDGTLLWDFNTARDFDTVNGAKARGGSLNATGPAIVGGMVYVDAGYTNGLAGNVLLAFSVDGK